MVEELTQKGEDFILLVEDDHFVANAYSIMLEKAGLKVAIAYNGQEALKLLETKLPYLIILDLIMPLVDGFSVLEEIKKSPILKEIPVIVASNLTRKEDFNRAIALGAKDFFIKSNISLDDLLVKIKPFLRFQ